MVSTLIFLLFGLLSFEMEVESKLSKHLEITPQSCLDYLKRGYKTNGNYAIYDFKTNNVITVYCDLNSEAGSAWTLVMSFALKNKGMKEFKVSAMQQDQPLNENSPNWSLYRMSLTQMTHLKSRSTHWRTTCSFPNFPKVDYTDYVRAKFTDFDILTFLGRGICKKVEYVNIRGHQCGHCTSQWWQVKSYNAPHINSPSTGCQLDASQGAALTEDNFGFYGSANNKFRCSAGPLSTTNWWFGGYL